MRYAPLLALLLMAPATLAQFDPRPLPDSPAASGANFANTRLDPAFFSSTSYVGAFAPGGERWDLPWAEYDPQNADYGDPSTAVLVTGQINANQTWTANNRYLLDGKVDIMDGVTVTIEPGTIIFGRGGEVSAGVPRRSALVVNRGARLIADGRADAPIVFTSDQPVGDRANGDWGGLVIAGRASINAPGGEAVLEGGLGVPYGGGASPNDDDDSGVYRYVRVEFSGIEFAPDNELNGITMGGVGRGTVMEYLQVSFNDDDSFEWFGGTVNGRYLISYGALDDDFDGDIGWRGNVQFGLIVRDPFLSDVSTSNGFEQDNAPSEPNPPQTPRSAPVFSNITVLGPLLFDDPLPAGHLFGSGVHVRRASRFSLYNSIVSGFPTGLRMDGPNVAADAESGELQIRNSIFTGGFASNQAGFSPEAWFNTPAHGNTHLASPSAIGLVNPYGHAFASSAEPATPSPLGALALEAAYPNPASGQVTLAFSLEASQHARLAVYDLLGREVAVVTDALAPADKSTFSLDVSGLASGLYLVRLQTEGGAAAQRLTVAR
jgi:hypothetical protein